MKAGFLSTTISILLSLVITSASASDDLRVLKKSWSNKASKKQKSSWSDSKASKKQKSGSNKASKKQKKSPKGIKDDPQEGGCEDPLAAIMQTLQYIADGDPVSSAKGYAYGFRKIHNGEDVGLDFGDDPAAFWEISFLLISLSFSFDHQVNVGPNMASIRYIEGVQFTDGTVFGLPASDEYPFNTSYVQHEHALVTVDDDCKMLLWDQYGDNAEQDAVNENIDALVEELNTVPEP
jgi:hypothetical protein